MNFYHKPENVQQYRSMMADYDNSTVLHMVREVLPFGSSLLELGMGTGLDLLDLSQNYQVIGSDFSPVFVSDFRREHPEIPVYELNAVDFSLNKKFDCIYSNKVLYHLSAVDFQKSLQIQAEHLSENGIIFLTLWLREFREKVYEEDLRFTYYTEKDIENLLPKNLQIEKMTRYAEMEADDSIAVILRRTR